MDNNKKTVKLKKEQNCKLYKSIFPKKNSLNDTITNGKLSLIKFTTRAQNGINFLFYASLKVFALDGRKQHYGRSEQPQKDHS